MNTYMFDKTDDKKILYNHFLKRGLDFFAKNGDVTIHNDAFIIYACLYLGFANSKNAPCKTTKMLQKYFQPNKNQFLE